MKEVEEQVQKTVQAAGVLQLGRGNWIKLSAVPESATEAALGPTVHEWYGDWWTGTKLIELFSLESRD